MTQTRLKQSHHSHQSHRRRRWARGPARRINALTELGRGFYEKTNYFRLARGLCGTGSNTGRLLRARETRAANFTPCFPAARDRGRRARPDHRQQARSKFDQDGELVEKFGSARRLCRPRNRDGAIHEEGLCGERTNCCRWAHEIAKQHEDTVAGRLNDVSVLTTITARLVNY